VVQKIRFSLDKAVSPETLMPVRFGLATLALAACASGLCLLGASLAWAQQDPLPEGPGKAELVSDCTSCHGVDVMTAQKRTKTEWTDIMTRMAGYGAATDPKQQKVIADYLLAHFGKPDQPPA